MKKPQPSSTSKTKSRSPTSTLVVQLHRKTKSYLTKAAKLRNVSVSDYARTVIIAQAQCELGVESDRVIRLSSEDQLAFWNALNDSSPLTAAQKRLGALMRGEQ